MLDRVFIMKQIEHSQKMISMLPLHLRHYSKNVGLVSLAPLTVITNMPRQGSWSVGVSKPDE